MALEKIKQGLLTRQMHLARAGVKAGIGWAGDHIGAYTFPPEQREIERSKKLQLQAEKWVRQLGELKGSIVKIGQILATYADYCLPAPIASALHLLEAETEPLSWRAISPLIQSSMGKRKNQLIIERSPIAAASLSQVHKATIRESNDVICLKILYPGILNTLDCDLAAVKNSLGLLLKREEKKRLTIWISSIREILLEELNLKTELSKLEAWKIRLLHDERYVIPTVYLDYCTQDILAMSFEEGIPQHHELIASLPLKNRNALAESMLELFLREVFIWGEMQTDPHPGNYRIRINKQQPDQLILLDFGSVRKIDDKVLKPLQAMIYSAYYNDRDSLLQSIFAMNLIDHEASPDTQADFVDVLMGLVEPLNYKARLAKDPDSIPPYAYDKNLDYRWRAANLPKRMAKIAMQSAVSKEFSFPGADFLFLSRKLAGVYAFIASLDARFDGGKVLDKILAETDTAKI